MKPLFTEDPLRVAHLLAACEELAEKLEIEVVTDSIPSLGGLCRVRSEWRLYLNSILEPEETLDIFAAAFAQFDLSDHYVVPALRDEIERFGENP